MGALTGDVYVTTIGAADRAGFSANGADTFYKGALVFIDTNGGVQSVPAAGDRCLGVSAFKQVTTVAGQEIEVFFEGLFWVPLGSGITAADEGDYLMMTAAGTLSDNFADTVSATDVPIDVNDLIIGQIVRVKAASMLIGIEPGFTGRLIPAPAIAPPTLLMWA